MHPIGILYQAGTLYFKTHDLWWHPTMQYHSLFLAAWFKNPCSLTILYILYFFAPNVLYCWMACLYAYTPNVPSNVYERHWFCSCKCNVLINPPSKTSSCQAVSIIWSECQQAPILRSVISEKCRVANWLRKRFSVWWKWAKHMFWGISSCNWMWYLSHCLMECKGRCLAIRNKTIEKMEESWLHSITR